jgi:hypothetical protein
MGLTEGMLIMSGHQAGIWHAGILAKHMATTVAAEVLGAAAAWIVVDQDAGDPQVVAYPGRVWERCEWNATGNRGSARAAGKRRTEVPGELPREVLCGAVFEGMTRVQGRAELHMSAESLGAQYARANADLVGEVTGPCELTWATRMARTGLFRACVELMMRDPGVCVEGYNAAARARPEAGISLLQTGADCELPVWVLEGDGTRVRARASMLDKWGREGEGVEGEEGRELAPRALLMTLLLRMSGCDLFVHGLGGGVYDTITEQWVRSWMPRARLAPTAVVSATRFARPEGAPPGCTREDVQRAVWLAHRARHDPHVLGLEELGNEKDALVREVKRVRESGGRARGAYMEMQEWLERYRQAREADLTRLGARADALRSATEPGGGVWDRTWPWVFLNRGQIEGLREEIKRAFAGLRGYARA